MHRNRKAKIVATIGPASDSKETVEALFHAGVDVFRMNFSHGTNAVKERIPSGLQGQRCPLTVPLLFPSSYLSVALRPRLFC